METERRVSAMVQVLEREAAEQAAEIKWLRELVGWHFWTADVFRWSLHRQREGKQWSFYFDFDLFIQNPSACEAAVALYTEKLTKIAASRQVNALAFIDKADGGTIGAIALAGAISIKTNIPHIPVRLGREVRSTRIKASDPNLPLGYRLQGKNLVLITDHVTTGGEVMKAIRAIRDNKGYVSHVIAFTAFYEEFSQAKQRFLEYEDGPIDLDARFYLPDDLQDLQPDLFRELETSLARSR